MPFPVVFLILSSVLTGPAMTFEIFRRAENRERDQIAVDNQRIETGRRQRGILNELARANQTIREFETLHHLVHACARMPATAAKCLAQDKLLETQVRSIHDLAGTRARSEWAAMLVTRAYPGRATLSAEFGPGIREAACPACGLPVYWRANAKQIARSRSNDGAIRGRVEVEGDLQLWKRDWNYRLVDE